MSHDPAHRPARGDDTDEPLSTVLALAQFLVTGLILFVIAALAYIAGSHSARGGGEKAGGAPATGPAAQVDVKALLTPAPELIAKGKNLFAVNCASCHGTEGKGNGPAAAALNPKPRDFTSGYWRYGGGVARVVRTISTGSPGTAMAAFTGIPLEDRIALAHYVRSLSPKPEADKPEDLAWLAPTSGGGAAPAGGGAAAVPAPAAPAMPIERAIALLAEPETPAGATIPPAEAAAAGGGSDLYGERCASCHGASGEGGTRVRMLGSAPYAYVVTRSLGAATGPWIGNPAAFDRLVIEGLPGYAMPGNGDLSKGELRDLHGYTLKLRALQESSRRAGS